MENNIRKTELDDISKQMKTRQGRRFMWRVLQASEIFVQSGSLEGQILAAREGKRSTGLMLLADIMTVDPDGYILMAKEAKARLEAKEKEDERDREQRQSEFD